MKTESFPEKSHSHPPHAWRRATRKVICWLAFLALAASVPVRAQVPNLLNYQGRVAVGGVNFPGPTGQFKFALVNATGTTTYWSNDGTSAAGSQPTGAVSLAVTNGLYSVLLGDASLPLSMTPILATVWRNPDVRLRVWFYDNVPAHGFQLLTPDQRIAPNGYLPNGSVFDAALAANAVTRDAIKDGEVIGAKIANATIDSGKLSINIGLWTASGNNMYRSSGNVGIGLSNPIKLFQVRGASEGNYDSSVAFIENTNTTGTSGPALRLLGAGNSVDGVLNVGSTSSSGKIIAFGGPSGEVANMDTEGSFSFGYDTRQMLNLWGSVYGIGVQNNTFYTRSDGGFAWFNKGVHSDATNDPGAGGQSLMTLDDSGNLQPKGAIKANGGLVIEYRQDGTNPPAETGRIWLVP